MKKFLPILCLTALLGLTIGCGESNSTGTGGTQTSSVFVTGEDAPVASVVAFNITINSITRNIKRRPLCGRL